MLTGIAGHGDPNSSLPYASSLCGACYDVCPVKIDIPTILVELRAQVVDADRHRMIPGGWDAALKAASWVMSDEKRFAIAEKGLAVGRLAGGRKGRIRHLPPPLSGWTASRDLPAPPAQTFRNWWKDNHPEPRYRHRARDWSGETVTTSRDIVMDKIRAALADDGPPIPVPRDYIRRGQHDPGSGPVIELLVDRLVDYRALVHQVSAEGLPAALDEALSGMTSVVIGAGLDPAIAQACTGSGRTVTTDSAPQILSPQELDAIDAVVTTARVAIAMSGTIILDGGAGQGRRAITLVPDRHIIVLTADQIVETVAEAISRLNPTAPLTMIAGPSATSDIELERVEGDHDPHPARDHHRMTTRPIDLVLYLAFLVGSISPTSAPLLRFGLAMFAFRYVIPADKWPEKAARLSFWCLNIGLAWMVFATLLPLGVLQLYHSVNDGYFEARSLGYITRPGNALLEWLRLPAT